MEKKMGEFQKRIHRISGDRPEIRYLDMIVEQAKKDFPKKKDYYTKSNGVGSPKGTIIFAFGKYNDAVEKWKEEWFISGKKE